MQLEGEINELRRARDEAMKEKAGQGQCHIPWKPIDTEHAWQDIALKSCEDHTSQISKLEDKLGETITCHLTTTSCNNQ